MNYIYITKENIDIYLKELAKDYRKAVGKNMPAEIILIGGASVLINYGFRNMTTDIDAMIHAASVRQKWSAAHAQEGRILSFRKGTDYESHFWHSETSSAENTKGP